MGGLPTQNTSTLALPGLQQNQESAKPTTGAESKPKKKICCACPETKKLRDECIVQHGEEACAKWIEAHRAVCAAAASTALALAIVLSWSIHHNIVDVAAIRTTEQII
ncbi:hypothetical protein Gohar_028451 [Gossypium harknessii]|uniref:Cytochrome c oxidase copper chaperone n=1 Tax=Gossypium harknessii TaxID=34285 RepID=A0A7J9IAT1_9ROSI|nr:hypothetical protein [Gossypium harknessii]